jgi:putative transposase
MLPRLLGLRGRGAASGEAREPRRVPGAPVAREVGDQLAVDRGGGALEQAGVLAVGDVQGGHHLVGRASLEVAHRPHGARAPRIHAELRHRGVRASRKRVARLMRQAGLSGMVRRRKGKTTIRVPGIATAPDLVRRDFTPRAPNRLWVADLTEVATWEGKLYLAVVVDAFSRRCVGWVMAEHMRAELVVEALEMAIWQRRPDAGLIHHSDRGSQYVSLIFGQRARDAGIAVSMGAKGCALDNAVCEAFFATLKKELTRRRSWPTRRELQSAIFTWIEGWYNRRRLHSTLGYLSPVDYENGTLGRDGASLAASRLAQSPIVIK